MTVRMISASEVRDKVIDAIEQITYRPDPAVTSTFKEELSTEKDETRRDVLCALIDNAKLASEQNIPLCQDTGTLVVFASIGNRVIIDGAPLQDIINEALAMAAKKLYLRASMVRDPILERINTGNACPAVLHIEQKDGDDIILLIAQKGGGAENMSRLTMLSPAAGFEDVLKFTVDTVVNAGAKACPPLVIGIGLGGNFEMCAQLAKRALFQPILSKAESNPYSMWEHRILEAVNATNIGAQGMGGPLTAVAVNILSAPCHIASLPLAVNLQCHAHRHVEIRI